MLYKSIRHVTDEEYEPRIGTKWYVVAFLLSCVIIGASILENSCEPYEYLIDKALSLSRNLEKTVEMEKAFHSRHLHQLTCTEKLEMMISNLKRAKNTSMDVLEYIQDHVTKHNFVESSKEQCTYNVTWTGISNFKNNGTCDFNTVVDPSVCYKKMKRMVFIGDSMTWRTILAFRSLAKGITDWKWKKRAPVRCPGKFYDSHFAGTYDGKKHDDMGPLHYGIQHPGCTDCSGCDTFSVSGTYNGKRVSYEYLAMEFAKDKMLQTKDYGTTQEYVIEKYLKPDPPDLVYFSFGAHDMEYVHDAHNATFFSENVDWFLNLLKTNIPTTKVCVTLFPRRWWRGRDELYGEMNRLQREIILKHNLTCVIDGENLGHVPDKYQPIVVHDGTHFPVKFYEMVLKIMVSLAC